MTRQVQIVGRVRVCKSWGVGKAEEIGRMFFEGKLEILASSEVKIKGRVEGSTSSSV